MNKSIEELLGYSYDELTAILKNGVYIRKFNKEKTAFEAIHIKGFKILYDSDLDKLILKTQDSILTSDIFKTRCSFCENDCLNGFLDKPKLSIPDQDTYFKNNYKILKKLLVETQWHTREINDRQTLRAIRSKTSMIKILEKNKNWIPEIFDIKNNCLSNILHDLYDIDHYIQKIYELNSVYPNELISAFIQGDLKEFFVRKNSLNIPIETRKILLDNVYIH